MIQLRQIRVSMILGVCLAASVMQAAVAADAKTPAPAAGDAAALTKLTNQVNDLRDAVRTLAARLSQLELRNRQAPPRESVAMDGAPMLGDHKAKIGILEFSDFQCPFCRRFHEVVYPILKREYIDSGKVDYIVRDFPLYFHKHAMNAAIAVNCMRQQTPSAFWDIRDEMFSHQKSFGKDYYEKVAKKFGADDKRYLACIGDPKQKAHIEDSLNYGHAVGVSGTPTFFIGRIKGGRLVDAVRVEGVRPLSVFSEIIGSLEEGKGS